RSEQDSRQQFVLRQRRRAREGDLGLQTRALHDDARVEALDLCRRMDIEQRIRRAFALEADSPAVELEVAPREIIVAAHEVGAAGEARRIGETADLQAGPPPAVDPEPDHLEVASSKLEIELPRMEVRNLDHVFGVEPAFPNVELR